MERGKWGSNFGFLLAAVGSAVGLGNIWRFSFLCYKNGGGTFLVPYGLAMLTTGIPLLILEFALGHKMRASAPKSMHAIAHDWEWVGWWPVIFVMFGINVYYVVVIAWCALYMLYSVQSPFPWEGNTETYFYHEFLGLTDGVFDMGHVSLPIVGMTAVLWLVLWFICVRRVERGVEVACKIFMPVLFILTSILVVWGLFLTGAPAGVVQYLKPDWAKLGEVQVWREAFGQMFFSLSLGFGIMIAYASYLPQRTNLVRNAFITAIADGGYSIFAGFAVFSVLGYMAHVKGVGVDSVVKSGPGLCFVVYPEAISKLPAFNSVFGFLFFLTLVLAGLTSAMSIIEAFVAAAVDKFGWGRTKVVTVVCLVACGGSVVFTTGAGLLWLDIVDHFLNSYGLVIVGLLEAILVGWYYRIDHLHFHLSEAKQGRYPMAWDVWWEWSVKFVAPTALAIILAWSVMDEFAAPFGGYPTEALVMIGLGWVIGTFLLSGVFTVFTKHRDRDLASRAD
ncbi:MAG TPA: sodium-dependent transporter [Candidatus Hydrogenedentes bacterium]|nr:sodium-dependent transporter [Candidatus Hydrogenedentota bacterium]HPG68971.1 sodium-dependent transporter [Candidatus Hydrogenedentota bacterium]